MNIIVLSSVAILSLALSGCGNPEEPIDPAPVAQLQGPWHMINRAASCDTYYTVITPNSIVRLYEGGARKKYAAIKKFTLEPGKVTLLSTGVDPDPEKEVGLKFSLVENKLRLLDIIGENEVSYREPPKTIEETDRASMKTIFRLAEQRFAMDKCAGA